MSTPTLRKHLSKLNKSLFLNLLANGHKKKSITRGWLKRDMINKLLPKIKILAKKGASLGKICKELNVSRPTLNKWIAILYPQLFKQFSVNRKFLYSQPKSNSLANKLRNVTIRQIKYLVSKGFNCSEIADKLKVSVTGLKKYINNISNKLHIQMVKNSRIGGGNKRKKKGKVSICKALSLSLRGYSLRNIANITGYSFPVIVKYIKANLGKAEYKRRHLDRTHYRVPFYNERGELLRSGYEAIVADWLFKNGIDYETQSLLRLGNKTYRPDFRILKPKIIYLEVLGLLDKSEYRARLIKKRAAYTRNKIKCIYITTKDLLNLDPILGDLRLKQRK